jgi:hypothetical protein
MRRSERMKGRRARLCGLVLAVAAAACGGGGGSLADLAEGDWSCAYHQTSTVEGLGDQAMDYTARAHIAADSGTRGTYTMELTVPGPLGQTHSIEGDWRLRGRRLEVTVGGLGAVGTLEYRDVAEGTDQIEVRDGGEGGFTPVAVSRSGERVTFRWDPFEDIHATMGCRKV